MNLSAARVARPRQPEWMVCLAAAALLAVVWLAGMAAGWRPARLAMLLLLAPLVEEAVFRAGLQDALLRHLCPALAANLLTALVFALVHVVVRGDAAAMAVAAPALLIGACYDRWRRLRWCVAWHAAMNAVWIAGISGL